MPGKLLKGHRNPLVRSLEVVDPPWIGAVVFDVNGHPHSMDPSDRLAEVGSKLAYLFRPSADGKGGELWALTGRGAIRVPDALGAALYRKYFSQGSGP